MEHRTADSTGAAAADSVRVHHFLSVFVWIIALGLALYFFTAAKMILLGVLAAGCVASALHPLMGYVPGPRWGRAAAVGLIPVLVLGGLVALTSWLLAGPLAEEVQQWPQIRQAINNLLATWSERLGLDRSLTVRSVLERAGEMLTGSGGRELFSTAASAVTGTLIALAFMVFGTIFLLGEPSGRLLNPLLTLLPPHRRPQLRGAVEDLVPRLRWWLIGTLISMAAVGVASGIGYAVVGLNLGLPLAVLAGVSEIVPTLGPAATFLIALLFAATQGSGVVLGVAIVYGIVQLLESYVLLPLVMKEAVKIPPVVTLFTVVLWGQVFGAAGLLLAIPINLVLWSLADHLLLRPRAASGAIPAESSP